MCAEMADDRDRLESSRRVWSSIEILETHASVGHLSNHRKLDKTLETCGETRDSKKICKSLLLSHLICMRTVRVLATADDLQATATANHKKASRNTQATRK